MVRMVKFDAKVLKTLLKETDPHKLHEKATEVFDDLVDQPEELLEDEDLASVLTFAFSYAAFLEARAAYLNNKKRSPGNTGPR